MTMPAPTVIPRAPTTRTVKRGLSSEHGIVPEDCTPRALNYEVKRANAAFALVCSSSTTDGIVGYGLVDVQPSTDLQQLAQDIANHVKPVTWSTKRCVSFAVMVEYWQS